jgi:D-sedoheptulose 7-phosphate isomerase
MFGNGGSAAAAQHFAAELTGRFLLERPPLAAEALHANYSHMTAVSNDYKFDDVFSRSLEASLKPEDTVFAITTSGQSLNVIRAAEVARDRCATVVAMTGAGGGSLKHLADILLNVPAFDTGRIQEAHTLLIHAVTEHVEHVLFDDLKRMS